MLSVQRIDYNKRQIYLMEIVMSRTFTISDELYSRLKSEAQARGLGNIERLLEERQNLEPDLVLRKSAARRIDQLRERLFVKYGQLPDSADLLREDRAR